MFTGKQTNAYDDIVAKTTDENLTSENWELILNLCDKVNDEGEAGSRNVIQALLKRLAHRNPNVQLYSLALAEALSKNCGIELHREMASRSFTQGLEKLITDRMTHEKVRRRALYLISLWTGEFESNSELGLMEDLYNNLKAKNYKFEQVLEPPPPEVDDEVRRKEEEELQRVLEMSLHDKGGRNISGREGSSSGVGGSSSSINHPRPGYTPVEPPRSAYPSSAIHHHHVQAAASGEPTSSPPPVQQAARASTSSLPEQTSPTRSISLATGFSTRVRALHSFEPTVAGELAFEKGDIIKVTDRAYDNWWRGQLRGRTGIFPVNYVEPLPDLTTEDLAREAEQEAAVFAQAASIDKLITMLRGLDPAKDNLADNEEIQELYRSSMTLRPKIVKLIDKYSQKRAELVAMNENFVKARGVFEQMMEESLARHTGVYDTTQSGYGKPQPDLRTPNSFGWNPSVYEQPGYNAYPAAPAAYEYQNQHYADPNAYSGHHQPPVPFPGMPQAPQQQPYPPVDSNGYVPPPSQTSTQGPTPSTHQPAQLYGHAAAPTDPQIYAQQDSQTQQQVQTQQTQTQSQPQSQPQPQPQPQSQPQSQQGQAQVPSPQGQGQHVQTQQGPPYVYDPNTQYTDPNVQAWAQYYAQGGTDPTGAVYFISVPGVKEPSQASAPVPAAGQKASVSPTASVHPASLHQQPQDSSQAPQSYASQPAQGQGQPQSIYQPTSYAAPSSPVIQHGPSQSQPGYQNSQILGALPPSAGPYNGGSSGYVPPQYGEAPDPTHTNNMQHQPQTAT